MDRKRLLGILKYVLGLGLGVGLLAYALWRVNWDELTHYLKTAHYEWVIGGMLFAILSHWLRAARWRQLLEAAGYQTHTPGLFASIMVGYLVNNAIPRGGEISRGTLTARAEKIPFGISFGTIVTDRIIDMLTMGVIGLGVLLLKTRLLMASFREAFTPDPTLTGAEPRPAGSGFPWMWVILGVMAAGMLLAFLLRKKILATALGQKLLAFSREVLGAIGTVRQLKSPLKFLLYTVGIWACYFVQFWTIFWAFDDAANLPAGFAVVSFTMGTLGMVFPSPGGVGSFHYAVLCSFLAFLAPLGEADSAARTAAASLGNSVAILNHTSQLIFMIIGGFLCYLYLLPRLGQKESTPAS